MWNKFTFLFIYLINSFPTRTFNVMVSQSLDDFSCLGMWGPPIRIVVPVTASSWRMLFVWAHLRMRGHLIRIVVPVTASSWRMLFVWAHLRNNGRDNYNIAFYIFRTKTCAGPDLKAWVSDLMSFCELQTRSVMNKRRSSARTECEPSQLVAAEELQYLMHPILNASQQTMLNGHPAKVDHA